MAGERQELTYANAARLSAHGRWDILCDQVLFVGEAWRPTLREILPQFGGVFQELAGKEGIGEIIRPSADNLFSWTRIEGCRPDDVKVVIIGMDPVPDARATGTAFVFDKDRGLGKDCPAIGNLLTLAGVENTRYSWPRKWCKQGVLMINNVPTISENGSTSNRHSRSDYSGRDGIGWEQFTEKLIKELCKRKAGIVFIQLGREAEHNLKTVMQRYTYRTSGKFDGRMTTPSVELGDGEKYNDVQQKEYNERWGKLRKPTEEEYRTENGSLKPNLSLIYPHPASRNPPSSSASQSTPFYWDLWIKGSNFFKIANEHLVVHENGKINWGADDEQAGRDSSEQADDEADDKTLEADMENMTLREDSDED